MRSIKYVGELEFLELTLRDQLPYVAFGLRRSSFSCSWSNSTMRCCAAWSNLKSKLMAMIFWRKKEKFHQGKEIPGLFLK